MAVFAGNSVGFWHFVWLWKYSAVSGGTGRCIFSEYVVLYVNWDHGSTVRRIRDTKEVRRITDMAFIILLVAAGIVTAVTN